MSKAYHIAWYQFSPLHNAQILHWKSTYNIATSKRKSNSTRWQPSMLSFLYHSPHVILWTCWVSSDQVGTLSRYSHLKYQRLPVAEPHYLDGVVLHHHLSTLWYTVITDYACIIPTFKFPLKITFPKQNNLKHKAKIKSDYEPMISYRYYPFILLTMHWSFIRSCNEGKREMSRMFGFLGINFQITSQILPKIPG